MVWMGVRGYEGRRKVGQEGRKSGEQIWVLKGWKMDTGKKVETRGEEDGDRAGRRPDR